MALDRLRVALALEPDEAAPVAWAALTFFALLGGYAIVRPVRDALVFEGDPAFVPWAFTATFVVMLAIAAPWGALVARWPRSRLVPRVYRGFAVQLLGFAALLHFEIAPAWVGKVFFVWVSVFNLFVVSVFWSLCADVAGPAQGQRWFGPIAAGGTAGALVGPLLARLATRYYEPAVLLVMSALWLEAAVACAAALDRRTRGLAHRAAPTARGTGGGAFAGVTHVARSRYLLAIAGYALAAAYLATFVYLKQGAIAKAALPDRAARTAFFADVEIWASLATIVVQALITSRLLGRFGVGVVLAVLPAVQVAGVISLGLVPTLAMATVVSASSRATQHALARPGRELLFTAVAREDKYKAKNFIDTMVVRFGDVSSAWLHRGLSLIGVPIAAVAVPLAAGWAALALHLGHRYRRHPVAPKESLS